ncbi:hypothetical protein CLU81_3557 [Flavobacterium sp. 9]|uniref:hypothetical protein n=1 Tax=Flavobacterium sp. 9 TaxID=2035198 RepID=UPI000C18E732|nr:hypothetical protein [Flavobacterium sp. 9]PIF32987.1 hypothetical protein CLU81_3557 [Flavobacterium sp. 9]
MRNTIVFSLAILSILSVVSSCGARKSNVSKNEEKVKTDFSGIFRNSGNSHEILNQDFNLKKWSFTNLTDQKDIQIEETSIEPIDISKPASYIDPNGKKHILDNAKIVSKKTNDKSSNNSQNSQHSEEFLKTKQEKTAEQKTELAAKIKAEAKKKEAKKETNRQAISLWNFLWIIIPVILFFAGRSVYKKYKKVNPLV